MSSPPRSSCRCTATRSRVRDPVGSVLVLTGDREHDAAGLVQRAPVPARRPALDGRAADAHHSGDDRGRAALRDQSRDGATRALTLSPARVPPRSRPPWSYARVRVRAWRPRRAAPRPRFARAYLQALSSGGEDRIAPPAQQALEMSCSRQSRAIVFDDVVTRARSRFTAAR
jgi:hypothetical protein